MNEDCRETKLQSTSFFAMNTATYVYNSKNKQQNVFLVIFNKTYVKIVYLSCHRICSKPIIPHRKLR